MAGCSAGIAEFKTNLYKLDKDILGNTWQPYDEPITPNAYGLGVHMDQYGRQIKLENQHGHSDPLIKIKKPDVYGPGLHMDQYGRPVRAVPRW